MNKSSAKEWLKKAYQDIKSAVILYDAKHYTDSIGVDLHYAIEKILKSILAYKNSKILKTHNLHILSFEIEEFIEFNEKKRDILNIATDYHIEEAYPHYNKDLLSREEIKEVLNFTQELFERVCNILDIEKKDLL